MTYSTTHSSMLGELLLSSDGESLTGLWLAQQKYHGNSLNMEMVANDGLLIFDEAKKWLKGYFAGENPSLSELKLAPKGTDFQKVVWDILCLIPYGQTITYGEIAKTVAQKRNKEKMSARAVGGAVGHNPISIIIPCHRVIGANSKLTGYAGGLDRKIWLLKHEGVENLK